MFIEPIEWLQQHPNVRGMTLTAQPNIQTPGLQHTSNRFDNGICATYNWKTGTFVFCPKSKLFH